MRVDNNRRAAAVQTHWICTPPLQPYIGEVFFFVFVLSWFLKAGKHTLHNFHGSWSSNNNNLWFGWFVAYVANLPDRLEYDARYSEVPFECIN